MNRTNSNTPLQALVMLNDPIYVEAARVFAQNIWTDGGKALPARLDWAFLRAVGRKPTVEERRILAGLYSKSRARFAAAPMSAQELLKSYVTSRCRSPACWSTNSEAPAPSRINPTGTSRP